MILDLKKMTSWKSTVLLMRSGIGLNPGIIHRAKNLHDLWVDLPRICTWEFLTIFARGEKLKPHPWLYELRPHWQLAHGITAAVALADSQPLTDWLGLSTGSKLDWARDRDRRAISASLHCWYNVPRSYSRIISWRGGSRIFNEPLPL